MNKILYEKLKIITEEEKNILNNKSYDKTIYTNGIVDGQKILEIGRLMDIKRHVRFINYPMHKHNFFEILYMYSGSTSHIINNEFNIILEEGEFLFFNRNTSHEILKCKEEDIGINFIILPEFFNISRGIIGKGNVINDFYENEIPYLHFKVGKVFPIQNLIESMLWKFSFNEFISNRQNQIFYELLFMELNNYTQLINSKDENKFKNIILAYIEENYLNGTLSDLSKELDMPIVGLSKLVKKLYNDTFNNIMQKRKLGHSKFLLVNTDLNIEDIIRASGYSNSSYFYKIFKKEYGISPKSFRDNYKTKK